MGKINIEQHEVTDYNIIQYLKIGYNELINMVNQESPKTDKKQYAVLSNDWDLRFNSGSMKSLYNKKWRKFRHYRTKNARDRAIVMLNHHYKSIDHRIKFIAEESFAEHKQAPGASDRSVFSPIILGSLVKRASCLINPHINSEVEGV